MSATSLTRFTRCTSVLALGAAALGGASQPMTANASSRKKNGDVNKRCKQQVEPCRSILTSQCEGNAQCIATTPACCDNLKTCAFDTFVACLSAALVTAN